MTRYLTPDTVRVPSQGNDYSEYLPRVEILVATTEHLLQTAVNDFMDSLALDPDRLPVIIDMQYHNYQAPSGPPPKDRHLIVLFYAMVGQTP